MYSIGEIHILVYCLYCNSQSLLDRLVCQDSWVEQCGLFSSQKAKHEFGSLGNPTAKNSHVLKTASKNKSHNVFNKHYCGLGILTL